MIRTPRLTFVSDGKPLRRLLIGSKAEILIVVVVVSHGFAPVREVEILQ